MGAAYAQAGSPTRLDAAHRHAPLGAMPFDCTVMTMFPEAFPGPLGVSLIGTAWREQNLWSLDTVDIRGFSRDKRGFLDDTPTGGGPGQVMRADVIASALDSVERRERPLVC